MDSPARRISASASASSAAAAAGSNHSPSRRRCQQSPPLPPPSHAAAAAQPLLARALKPQAASPRAPHQRSPLRPPFAAGEWLWPRTPPALCVRSLGNLSPHTASSSSSPSPSSSVVHCFELEGASDVDSSDCAAEPDEPDGDGSGSQYSRSAHASEPNSPAAAQRQPHSHSDALMTPQTAAFEYGVEGADSQYAVQYQSYQPYQHQHYQAPQPNQPHQPPLSAQPSSRRPPQLHQLQAGLSSLTVLHSAALGSPSMGGLPATPSLFSPSLDGPYGGGGGSSAAVGNPYSTFMAGFHSPPQSASFGGAAAAYSFFPPAQSSGHAAPQSAAIAEGSAAGAVTPQQQQPPTVPHSAFRRPSSDAAQQPLRQPQPAQQPHQSEQPPYVSSVRSSLHSAAVYSSPPTSASVAAGLSAPQSPSAAAAQSRFLPSFGAVSYAAFPSPSFPSPAHFHSPSHPLASFGGGGSGATDGPLPSPAFSHSAANPFVLPPPPYQPSPPQSAASSRSSYPPPAPYQPAAAFGFSAAPGRRHSTESADSQSPLDLPMAPSLMPSPSQPPPSRHPFAIPVDSLPADHMALSVGDGAQQLPAPPVARIKAEPLDMHMRAYYLNGPQLSAAAPQLAPQSVWSHSEAAVAPPSSSAPPSESPSSSLPARAGGAMGSIRPCSLCGVSLLHDFDEVQHALYVHARHLCVLCRHQSDSFAAHSAHLASHNPQRLAFSCSLCGKGFSKKFNMSTHFASHSALKRHECPQCLQLYSQKSYLRLHMRTHSGLKPYKCDWPGCGKSFGMRSDVKKHQRVHSGEKPYTCEHCGRSFNHSSNYNRHRRKRAQHCEPPDHAHSGAGTPASSGAGQPAESAGTRAEGEDGVDADDGGDGKAQSLQAQPRRAPHTVQQRRSVQAWHGVESSGGSASSAPTLSVPLSLATAGSRSALSVGSTSSMSSSNSAGNTGARVVKRRRPSDGSSSGSSSSSDDDEQSTRSSINNSSSSSSSRSSNDEHSGDKSRSKGVKRRLQRS